MTIKDIVKSHAAFLKTKITVDEKNTLKHYTGAGYKSINNALRKGGKLSARNKKYVDNIDSVFSKIPETEEPIILYRGVKNEKQILFHKGFTSATYSYSIASTFTGVGCCVVVIIIPVGSKVLSVESISKHEPEKEIILQRNGKFVVLGSEHLPGNPEYIFVTYIPPGAVEKDVLKNTENLLRTAEEAIATYLYEKYPLKYAVKPGVKAKKKVIASSPSVKRSVKRSAKRSVKKSPKRSAKRSVKKSPKRSAKRSVKKSPKRSAKRSVKRSAKRGVKKSPKRSVKRSVKRSAKKSPKRSAKRSAKHGSAKTVVELKALAKQKGLKGYSKLKKDDLLKLLNMK